jgi:hypothetical protein
MNLRKVTKAELSINPQNPRSITEDEMGKLIQSLITFPEMLLLIRPPVMGSNGISLGGNQRIQAMTEIRAYSEVYKSDLLDDQRTLRKRDGATEDQIVKFEVAMEYLLYDEDFFVVDVSFLSLNKQEEFIIKDNVPFGTWDWKSVETLWGKEKVSSWGLEIPKWIDAPDEEEEKPKEPEKHDEDVQKAHCCPECGYEFN